MNNVIELNRRRVFTQAEAQELLPIVWRITKQYSSQVQTLINRLEAINGKNQEFADKLEHEVNTLVHEWQSKLERLGVHTKGLWVADFDAGDGYFCWKFPEETIGFWHRYTDGFSGRVKVELVEVATAP